MTRAAKGFTAVELLVVLSIAATVGTVLFMAFSNYSRSFMRIDDRLENASRGWLIVQAIQEDILSLDVPDGDIKRWQEAVKETADGCLLTRRGQSGTTTVSYNYDKQERSLSRSLNGETRVLIKNRCGDFVMRPEFATGDNGEIDGIFKIYLKIKLEEPNNAQNRGFEPLLIEINLVPELLNRRLHHEYFHAGIPD